MSHSAPDGHSPQFIPHGPCGLPRDAVVEHTRDRGACLYVPLGAVCNNNCLFCLEDDRDARKQLNSSMRGDRVTSILEKHAGVDEVCFTSGEPTLHPELPLFLRQARDLGFPRVSVVTNGRRLAYPGFAAQLVRAGLNRIYVSIHGHNPALHDGLTRTPDSFAQTVAGIDAVVALRQRGLSVHTFTVLTTSNTPLLIDLYEWLQDLGVEQSVFAALQVTGRAARFVDQVVPSYTDVCQAFRRLLEASRDGGERAVLVGVPKCVTEGLDKVRPAVLGQTLGAFAPSCDACSHRKACSGVASAYAAHFGWSEFVPVVSRGS